MVQTGWFADARAILEVGYFLSGICIAIAAFYGLKQVRAAVRQLNVSLQQLEFTKRLTETNNKREAVKLAAEQCRYFAEQVVPVGRDFVNAYNVKQLTCLPTGTQQKPQYRIKNGQIVDPSFDMKLLGAQMPQVLMQAIAYLNALESFAIPFAAGVADDEIGFQETAPVFCAHVQWCMPAVFYLFKSEGAKYFSLLTLYSVWNDRQVAKVVAPAVKKLQDWLEEAGKKQIPPI